MADLAVHEPEDDRDHDDDSPYLCPSCYRSVPEPDLVCDACDRCDWCGTFKNRCQGCTECGAGVL